MTTFSGRQFLRDILNDTVLHEMMILLTYLAYVALRRIRVSNRNVGKISFL